MAGRMGGTNVTVQNLRVIKVDPENNVLLVGGSVPGRKDSFLLIRKAIKKA
jgi:large subunit ribosomal protein L3